MDLELYLDEIIYALTQTVRKSGARTQSSETLFMLLMSNVRNDNALILLAIDEDMKLVGLLFAMADGVPKFAEVIAMWIKPSSWKDICMPALKILEEWGRTIGAKRMMAIVTRAPQKLFTKFYEPLGFEQVGLVLERRIS